MELLKWLFGKENEKAKSISANCVEVFDANNPNEILKIVGALCLIAANAGDSHVYVALQYENPAKGFSQNVTLLASIDNCSSSCTHDANSYIKFGVTSQLARYLATVPFKTKTGAYSNDFEITFTSVPDKPSSLLNPVINEMKKGVSQSKYIQAGVRHAKIDMNAGVLTCNID